MSRFSTLWNKVFHGVEKRSKRSFAKAAGGIDYWAVPEQDWRMNTSQWVQGMGMAGILWAAAAFAQEVPEPVVLTVLGTNYTVRDLGVEMDSSPDLLTARLFLKIQGGILGAFAEKMDYQPSEVELKEYCRHSAPTPGEIDEAFGNQPRTTMDADEIYERIWQEWEQSADDPYGAMRMAAEDLKQWKFSQALFEKYGGRVAIHDFLGPGVPDAARSHLEACEAAGDFAIRDAALRDRFWELMRTPSPVPLLSEEEGRAALAEHPADRQKRWVLRSMKERLSRPAATPAVAPPGEVPSP